MHFSSMTSNFLNNACTRIQNMAFKTSKMDQIALEYCCISFLRHLRVDGRVFFHQKPIFKTGSQDQKSRCLTCTGACHRPFNENVPISRFYDSNSNKSFPPYTILFMVKCRSPLTKFAWNRFENSSFYCVELIRGSASQPWGKGKSNTS